VIAAVALVAALLGGGIGGYAGYESARGASTGTSAGVLTDPLPPADPNATPLGPVEAVAARVLPSVVQLQVEGVRGAGEGSGIVLSADGLLLTNNHVVEAGANGGRVVALFQDGTSAPAQIVGRDPSSDLAVLAWVSRWWRSAPRWASVGRSPRESSAR
jgi:putative serine protease PepD